MIPLLEPALRHAGLPPDVVPLGSKEAATAMLRELPTLWAVTELKRLQHQNPARPWVRHTDLKNEFYQHIKEKDADNGDEARLRATIARLKKTLAAKNKELAQLRADVPALVRAVNQLTLENQQLRDTHASTGGSVIPFPGRAPARPRD